MLANIKSKTETFTISTPYDALHISLTKYAREVKWIEVKWILYLPSDCSVALTANISEQFNCATSKEQSTTQGTSCPTRNYKYMN